MSTANQLITPVAASMIRGFQDGYRLLANWSGQGCGKTYAMIQTAHFLAETRKVITPVAAKDGRPIPGKYTLSPPDILLIADTHEKLKGNLMSEAEKYFADVRGARLYSNPENLHYKLENGATIKFKSYTYYPSSGKNSILGQKYVAILSDETHELHESFLTEAPQRARLRNICTKTGKVYSGQVAFVGMPQANDYWLRFCRDLSVGDEERGLAPMPVKFIHIRTNTNPVLDPDHEERVIRPTCSSEDEFIATCQIVPGATFAAKGSYYDNVSGELYPKGNVLAASQLWASIDEQKPSRATTPSLSPTDTRSSLSSDSIRKQLKNYPTYISYDPGNNSTSVLFWQFHKIDGKRKAVIVDQYVPDEFTSDQTLLAYLRNSGYNIVQAIVDPFRGNQRSGQADGKTTVMLLQRSTTEDPDGLGPGLGVKVSANWPQYKTFVKDGIWRTRARICTLDGDRSILILDNVWNDDTCKRGIKFSLQNYGPDMKTGEPSKKGASEKASHICDAMRYFVIEHLWDTPEEEQKVSTPSRAKPSVQRQHFTQKNPSAISFGRSGSYGR